MKKRITTYGGSWLALTGCLAEFVSVLMGASMPEWQQLFWVGIVAAWVGNYTLATRTGQAYKRERDFERQRNRSMWS